MEQFLMTIEDAVFYLKSLCSNMDTYPTDFRGYYCGITNDLERRAGEHKAEFLGHVTAKTVKGALDLEIRMHEEGFYTGEQLGNAGDDSVYMYVYKMGPHTVE